MTKIKLQKLLADLGHCSRRAAEVLIQAGRVHVNDELAHLGQRVSEEDRVKVDGQTLQRPIKHSEHQVLMLNKAVGTLCTRHDAMGRPTVFDGLPKAPAGRRWIGIGRLDLNTSGLYLCTTNGDLAHQCMHPSRGLKRYYRARLSRMCEPDDVQQLMSGIKLADGVARFDVVQVLPGTGRNRSVVVQLSEGRNRVVRRLFNAVGIDVNKLSRLQFGPIQLDRSLSGGASRRLTQQEVGQLYKAIQITDAQSA